MFTLKFYRSSEEGFVQHSVACPRYEVYESQHGCGHKSVAVFLSATGPRAGLDSDAVEYHIDANPDINEWNYCYVENQSGKTIDTIRPKQIQAVG